MPSAIKENLGQEIWKIEILWNYLNGTPKFKIIYQALQNQMWPSKLSWAFHAAKEAEIWGVCQTRH